MQNKKNKSKKKTKKNRAVPNCLDQTCYDNYKELGNLTKSIEIRQSALFQKLFKEKEERDGCLNFGVNNQKISIL